MREEICAALAGLLLCTALPTAGALQCRKSAPAEVMAEPPATAGAFEAALETESEATMQITDVSHKAQSFDHSFNLPVLLGDGVDSMTLHNYLVGALVGEMPLSFDVEALKAQAIACRTYALRQYAGRKHDPAAVCTASDCCECWKDADGIEEAYRQKAEQAVSETDGLVLTYDGSLIEATFFSCSGGRTETAADVWGNDIPYLRAVDSPGEEAAPRFSGTVCVSAADARSVLIGENAAVQLGDDPTAWFGEVTYTQGGGVGTVSIGGSIFTGKQLRKLFALNSTDFEITADKEQVTFQTKGFGHRVGLSQYGAQAMAQSGADFRAILAHYYTDTTLTDCRTFYP